MAEVEFMGVHKAFGRTTVVHDLNLKIEDGEFFVLVGPSGCGKTTALRMVAGLEQVARGDIRIGTTSVIGRSPKDRNVSMVFQNYALFPHMTVFDNIAYGLRVRGEPRAEIVKKVQAVAEVLELTPYLQRRPAQLSGGQRQRVALGRAMVREPDVFLLDEPLSNLDAQLRNQMRVELARLHQRLGTTAIYVTHDQVEAMTLGHRLAVMRGGHLQQVGRPADVYRYPANRFVAGFLGSMNFLTGRPHVDRGKAALVVGENTAVPLVGDLTAVSGLPPRVELGIRPEHVHLHPVEVRTGDLAPARVTLVEQVGANTLVHLEGAFGRLVAMQHGLSAFDMGQAVRFSIPAEHCHWFEPEESGRRIEPEEAGIAVAVGAS